MGQRKDDNTAALEGHICRVTRTCLSRKATKTDLHRLWVDADEDVP